METDVSRQIAGSSEEAQAAVRTVLAFETFRRAPGLARLLAFLCQRAAEREDDRTTEYDIAFDVLNRPPDFDPATDSRVRVETHRLRKRLVDYYTGDGAHDPVRIVLPPGLYTPQFHSLSPAVHPEPGIDPRLGTTKVVPSMPSTGTTTLRLPLRAAQANARQNGTSRARLAALLVFTALLVGGFAPPYRQSITPAPLSAREDTTAMRSADRDAAHGIRLLAGATVGQYVDSLGHIWGPDAFYEGGTAKAHTVPVFGGADPFLFQQRREGDFAYRIPVPPGRYRLHLYFAEPQFGQGSLAGGGEGTRIFDVRLNGERLLTNLDVLSDAGDTNVAVERIFDGVSPADDGRLHLSFEAVTRGLPVLNAIAVVPAPTPGMPPVRIRAHASTSYVDESGRFWGADRYFVRGQSLPRTENVEAEIPSLHRGERYGNFSYAIPVLPGRYTATLRFSEQWFGSNAPLEPGIGRRLFDVLCNGRLLIERLDIFAATGGPRRELVKVFHGLRPDAQNRLVFSFRPILNYAVLNALEIVQEDTEMERHH